MVKSTAWNVRIDELPGVTREKVAAWSREHGSVLTVWENSDKPGGNPHFHMALRTEEVTQETIRNWVKKLFPGEFSRSDFQTAVWDSEDKLLKYFSKGPGWKNKTPGTGPDVVYTTLLDATIKSFHEDFWKENSARGEKVKKSKSDLIDEVYERVKGKKITNWFDAVHEVTEELLKEMSGKVNDNVLFPLVQSIMWKLDPGSVTKLAFERMLNKFGPRQIFQMSQQAENRPEEEIITYA